MKIIIEGLRFVIKFVEWLIGYHHGLLGSWGEGPFNYINGFACGYERGEVESGRYI